MLGKSLKEGKMTKGKKELRQRLMGSQIREEVVVVERDILKGVVT